MESAVVRQGGARRRRIEWKAVRQGGSRQSRLAWMGDGRGSEEVNGVGMYSAVKHICLFNEETPSHGPILPPIVRIARRPNTPCELKRYIGAESMRTIRQEREL